MYYISYGSNMNIEQMKYRCPKTKVFGNGRIEGWKLVFNCHADIIETGNKDDFVPVVVWNLEDEWDAQSLDRYEGYPYYYNRIIVPVKMDNGRKIRGMVYIMNDKCKGICPPTEGYFNGIVSGYYSNGIDTKPLYEALDHCLDIKNITKYNQYHRRRESLA